MNQTTDFGLMFRRLASEQRGEETVQTGGVTIRLVRVEGGGEGRWDSHDGTTEIAVLWGGDFSVEFRDHTVTLSAGQCCVVPVKTDHRGTSKFGAELVLFTQTASGPAV